MKLLKDLLRGSEITESRARELIVGYFMRGQDNAVEYSGSREYTFLCSLKQIENQRISTIEKERELREKCMEFALRLPDEFRGPNDAVDAAQQFMKWIKGENQI